MGRRFLKLLLSFYFDDAHVTDISSNRFSSQWSLAALNEILGTPFAAEKSQKLAQSGTFLGLDFDFSTVASTGAVAFWVRERLERKVCDLLEQARQSQSLSPGVSKLYGMLNFLEQGVWGRIGCGGLGPLKAHQYQSSKDLSPSLLQAFELIEALLRVKPRRQFYLAPRIWQRCVIASDAALEQPRKGTGGFLIVWQDGDTQTREAFVANIPPDIYSLWSDSEYKIAQLELLMVFMGILTRASLIRNRRGVWFIDNVASLMCLIRGRSRNPELEQLSHLIHSLLFSLQTMLFWEYIPSASNWSDAISRLGAVVS